MKHFLAFIALCASPALLVAQPRILQEDWSQSGRVGAAGLSIEGRCVAITTTSCAAVIDKTGRELWRWNFSEGNRFIFATRVAVAPKCDWLVFAGGVGYHYVWIVQWIGRCASGSGDGRCARRQAQTVENLLNGVGRVDRCHDFHTSPARWSGSMDEPDRTESNGCRRRLLHRKTLSDP